MRDQLRLAVLADIHGNWPALQAVADDIAAWSPDIVVVNGDIVNSGPDNVACWDFVLEQRARHDWVVLRGNHEEYVLAWGEPDQPEDGPAFELARFSHWTYHQLGERVATMRTLPDRWETTAPDGRRMVAMHASLLGSRAGIYPHTTDADARLRADLSADLFVTSHTHIPHQRQIGRTAILNTGSVGLTGDGDHRAAYGRIVWGEGGWQAAVRRVGYDLQAAERAFAAPDYMEETGPLSLVTLVELRSALDAKTRWMATYQGAIMGGDITIEESVAEFLDTPEFRPFLGREGVALVANGSPGKA